MDLRAWIAEAATGDVVTPVLLTRDSTAVSEIGGGVLRAEVILAGYRTASGGRDATAIQKILDYCTGGRHTLVLTDGTAVVGEWLMWTHERDHDAITVPVTGFEWEKYPENRSQYREINVKNVDIGFVHALALGDAYNTYQPGDAEPVSVTTPTLGKNVTVKYPTRTKYYSEIVAEMDAYGRAEWRVVPTATWSGGAPTRISRQVMYQQSVIRSSHPDTLVKTGNGRRGGNMTKFVRSHDYSRLVQTAVGWGAGKGAKQRFATAQTFGWTERGYLATTRNMRFQGEYSNAQLEAKVEAALEAAQDPWETTIATLDTRRMSQLPKIGSTHDVTVHSSFTYPSGGSWRMRVGRIQWQYGSPFVGVEMEEV